MAALLDGKGMIQYANSVFLKFTGYQAKELSGKPLNFINRSQADYAKFLEQWGKLGEAGKWSGQILSHRKDGSSYTAYYELTRIQVEGHPEIAYLAASYAISEMIAELTAHRKKEDLAARERDQAKYYLNKAGAFILILDRMNKVQFINEKGCKLLGVDKEEVLGFDWVETFLPERERKTTTDLLQKIFDGNYDNADYFQSVILCDKGAEERVIIWHSSVLPDEDEFLSSVLLSGEDVTEMRELDRMKSELMNIVSHEIRTPLASIRGFSELMLHRQLSAEKVKSYLETIHSEAVRLSKFIDDFLDIQRLENFGNNLEQMLELEVFDMNAILAEAAQVFQSNNTHNLVISSSLEEAYVRADYDKIRRLVTNLISNAYKYSQKGLPVFLRCEVTEGNVRVTVEDKGLGVPPEAIPQLFSKFYRVKSMLHRKITGTGLGLAICKSIVEAHSGRIWVESEVNVGSRFIFELPKVVGLSTNRNT